jgi:bacterioferritin (cytochrome b1)
MEAFLRYLILNNKRHIAWLNTLSYLENCGARKIAEAEHPTLVRREMLKHAAEEFRHAHYLKEQIKKLGTNPPADYQEILGGHHSRRYLDRLEVAVCRLTKTPARLLNSSESEESLSQIFCSAAAGAEGDSQGLSSRFRHKKGGQDFPESEEFKSRAGVMVYPLVTYAIEKRAQKLYPAYHKALREMGSKVTVMSIIKEEEGHLEEMERMLADNPFKKKVCEIETSLFNAWFLSVGFLTDSA